MSDTHDDQPISSSTDEPDVGPSWAPWMRGRVRHPEPAFGLAQALFIEIPERRRDLLPLDVVGTFGNAHEDFTDNGVHVPDSWHPVEDLLPPDVTPTHALGLLIDTLGDLITASTDLATTLRYDRARSQVRRVLTDLDTLTGTGQHTAQLAARPVGGEH